MVVPVFVLRHPPLPRKGIHATQKIHSKQHGVLCNETICDKVCHGMQIISLMRHMGFGSTILLTLWPS